MPSSQPDPPSVDGSDSPSRPLVSIVLPAYNEAADPARARQSCCSNISRRSRHRFRFEILIVNDGSRDQTGAIADQLAAEFDGIRVFHHPRNFGLGQALKTGFAQFRGQYVIVLDIDLSYGPEHVAAAARSHHGHGRPDGPRLALHAGRTGRRCPMVAS